VVRGQGKWRWLTEEEAAVAEALANIMVPSDEETPGLDDVDVLGPPAIVTLDKLIAALPDRQELYARGLASFDAWAVEQHGRKFTELPQNEQIMLLIAAQRLHENWAARGNPLEKAWRRGRILASAGSTFLAAQLYPHLRDDCLQIFYTSRVSWVWLEYDGPPMDQGYPKLAARHQAQPMESR
jgi:hypothetical protein